MGKEIREQIELDYEEIGEFASSEYDHALIGVVEEFGGDISPLYDEEKLGDVKGFSYYSLEKMDVSGVVEVGDRQELPTDHNLDYLLPTGHNEDLLGIVKKDGVGISTIYDKEEVLNRMVSDCEPYDDADSDPMLDAIENYYFNFMGGYHGPRTWKCAILYKEYEQV